jgi:hypothetical protein
MTSLEIALVIFAVLVVATFVWGRRQPSPRIPRRDALRRREERDPL